MKKFLVTLIIVLLFSVNVVHADMGPKPSVDVYFKGLNETAYAALLGEGDGYGPWQTVEEPHGADEESRAAEMAFMNVQYFSYHYWGNFTKLEGKNNGLHWGYFAPESFIIALYFPSTGKVMISEPQSRRYFEQHYICNVTENGLEVREDNNIPLRILMIAVRVLITIVVEVLLGMLFGFRSKKQIGLIVKTNLFTQAIVNIVFSVLELSGGLMFALIIYIPLEFIIFLIEGIIYHKRLDPKWYKTWIYSLFANGITTYIGIFAGAFLK